MPERTADFRCHQSVSFSPTGGVSRAPLDCVEDRPQKTTGLRGDGTTFEPDRAQTFMTFPTENEIARNMPNDTETRATSPRSWPLRVRHETESR